MEELKATFMKYFKKEKSEAFTNELMDQVSQKSY